MAPTATSDDCDDCGRAEQRATTLMDLPSDLRRCILTAAQDGTNTVFVLCNGLRDDMPRTDAALARAVFYDDPTGSRCASGCGHAESLLAKLASLVERCDARVDAVLVRGFRSHLRDLSRRRHNNSLCIPYGVIDVAAQCGNLTVLNAALELLAHPADRHAYAVESLCAAASNRQTGVVRALLSRPENALQADCQDGEALVLSAGSGHLDVVRMLLAWPEHAPRADCQDGNALVSSAGRGHLDVVRTLLAWPEHAPRADCQGSEALAVAAGRGHLDVVRTLLAWPEHAPRADSNDGDALVYAAVVGQFEVVKLLVTWPQHAPVTLHCLNNALRLTQDERTRRCLLDAARCQPPAAPATSGWGRILQVLCLV